MNNFWQNIDWLLVLIYVLLVGFGLVNIYSVEYDQAESLFDTGTNSGKQVIWIGISFLLAIGVLFLDSRFFITFSYYFYGIFMVLLVVTFLTAPEIKGARSWLVIGGVRLGQTAEFAKFATVLALAKFFDAHEIDFRKQKNRIIAFIIILIPTALVVLQNDTGTSIVFLALILVLFREGLPTWLIVLPVVLGGVFVAVLLYGYLNVGITIGLLFLVLSYFLFKWSKKLFWTALVSAVIAIGFSYGVDYAFTKILKPHQQTRINVLLGIEEDIRGAGYNVHQSLITIGSGGVSGKGFAQGTQTRGAFVPEQTTDFIFCTVGEEYGFLGTSIVVILFTTLLIRIILLAENQKSRFARVYGYGLVSIIFCHFFLNIAMTLGLFPVIGIPLPFFSYGGSSLIGFTVLLFIFIKLDAGLKYYF